jgi:pimeloyl-ACP methyl ester carboxylesterase
MVRRPAVALSLVLLFAHTTFAADHPSFRMQVSGSGRRMILIPGLASSGKTWDTTVARYRTRFTCYVLTVAGFAGVPPIDGPLLPAVRRDLAEYIRAQKLDRPILVGHSLGGTLALSFAIEYRDLVGALVIVDILPFLAGPNMQVKTAADAEPAIAAMEACMSKMTQEQWDASAKTGANVRYMVTGDAGFETLKAWGMATDRNTLIRALAEVYRADLREDIAESPRRLSCSAPGEACTINCSPTRSTSPRPTFSRNSPGSMRSLPRLHFALHDTSGQFIMWEDPEWFFGEVDAFLADPPARVQTRGF